MMYLLYTLIVCARKWALAPAKVHTHVFIPVGYKINGDGELVERIHRNSTCPKNIAPYVWYYAWYLSTFEKNHDLLDIIYEFEAIQKRIHQENTRC